ncbi:amidohydrolase [Cohnella pontilimi]|uniref:Amidohydrolase n=1 Tax=Cohnella pontilimi TaxID=2564100 RepID=A0A4U0FD42_9BACL|nr:amidohydrolase family protein [Cohnella pontilimi]TJY42618.1 amidohydrolase [Cohnella pontilimi]
MAAKNEQHDIIDCDVHPVLTDFNELIPYLDESIQQYMNIGKFSKGALDKQNSGSFRFPASNYANPLPVPLRADAFTPAGGLPGSDPQFLAKDLFDRLGTKYGILNIGHGTMSAFHNVEVAAKYTSAVNDWLYEKWVKSDTRYRMTMEVTPLDPELAVKEIERIGKRPEIVGINMHCVNIPLGKRHYWPIYEIAEAYNLPIMLHPDTEGTGEYAAQFGVGPASTYMEWHTSLGLIGQRNVISLVCDGVFERFPNLRVNFLEYGFSWVAAVMWRMDKNWKALRHEVPWVKRLPSEYIRSNIRFGTQPIEEPNRPKDLVELIQMIQAEDLLLFCSDYPHWDGDELDRAFLHFPEDLKRKIYYENPLRSFRFGEAGERS